MTSRYLSIALFIALFSLSANAANYWNDVPAASIQTTGERVIKPEKFRTLSLNIPEMKTLLQSAPLEKNVHPKNSNSVISLPMPDGTFLRFKFVDSPIMEDGLAAQFPEIKTYLGQGIDDPYSSVRFDMTPLGFHAMIFSERGTVFIDPYAKGDNFNYQSYFKSDFHSDKKMSCEAIDNWDGKPKQAPHTTDVIAEGQLRTYRTVVACTGEYAAYFGGTVNAAMAAIVVSMNRVNGVYENEVSVRMVLVANNSSVVYTNASTDPYTNANGNTMLGQNQTTCDNVIGTANYDMGHVFSTGGGGVAYLGCVCVAGNKARGVTGDSAPVGDPYDIDYVAHEMGHQFGGNHSFNSQTSSCGGGNRNNNTAFEPGSGSTIMAYAGICGADDLQPHSDPYFHVKNLDEIIAYTSVGSGNSCPVTTTTGNLNPVVTVPNGGFTIPISTPFELTGSATDGNSDPLKYCWEEYDLGPAGTANNPSGNAPIFRSFNPVTSGTRVFPKVSNLINNTTTIGELLPTYARNLSFRLTARDYRAGGGGIGYSALSFSVSAGAGPFLVTSPNTAITWNMHSPQTVTWNVANTSAAPVSAANVDIFLSTDGGNTFPTTLATGVPNNGSASVTLPNIQNSSCRIKVKASNNIFFDISNTNFTITNVVGIGNVNAAPLTFNLAQNYPNPFNPTTLINFTIPKTANVTLKVYDMKGELVTALIDGILTTEGNYSYEFDGSKLASGMYFYKIEAGQYSETKKMILVK
ncbi:MAG: T9SS type A sorting domain-containing protein [Bacteroidetes bacterium]|nr:T9SS type A sorting domain-containing protein [Bacteroidota bacterium]